MKTQRKVLFYGSIPKTEYESTKAFLTLLIPKLIERDIQIITREGTPNNGGSLAWLDNMVLDVACVYCARHHIDLMTDNKVISYSLDGKEPSAHKRCIINLPSSDRFSGYKRLMEKCDAVIGIGGAGGVYRFGLVAGATNHLFIPISIAKGDAAILAKELFEYLEKNYSSELVDYITRSSFSEYEVVGLVNAICESINNTKPIKKEISKDDFIAYIEQPGKIADLGFSDFINILKKLPISWIISFLGLTLTVVVLFILQLIL